MSDELRLTESDKFTANYLVKIFSEPRIKPDPVINSIAKKAIHKPHFCRFCGESGHYWNCAEPAICGIPGNCACPEFASKYANH